MAGYRKKRGRVGYEVYFYTLDKVRRSIWLSGFSGRQCKNFVRHIEELLRAAKANDMPEADTAAWLDDLAGPLREKLVAFGLASASTRKQLSPEERTVGAWTQNYIDGMLQKKPRTHNNYQQARDWLLTHIKESVDISAVTAQELKRWQASMKGQLSISTRNKHVQRVRSMFLAAFNDRVIRENPAAVLKQESLPDGRKIDRSRHFFVGPELTGQVLRGLPDARWKLIFCLLRFQGLRRHEVFRLRWEHVDWAASLLQIHSDKTGQRECPIFPETREALRNAITETPDPSSRVVPWIGTEDSLTSLLRKQVVAITGSCWPKVCNQLRSTRRTELDELFPSQCVNEWLGHGEKVAEKHYQQVTLDHWQKAVSLEPICSTLGSTAGGSTTQHAVEQTPALPLFPGVQMGNEYPLGESKSLHISKGNAAKPQLGSTTGSTIGLNLDQQRRLLAVLECMSAEQLERLLSIGEALVSTPKVRACEPPDDMLSQDSPRHADAETSAGAEATQRK